ncbi:hypothetical protein LTR27_001810 [Elasticomyces elasticus]|nr:hypothetical protein LTR27_001810 [Elasticomyces elasticus]
MSPFRLVLLPLFSIAIGSNAQCMTEGYMPCSSPDSQVATTPATSDSLAGSSYGGGGGYSGRNPAAMIGASEPVPRRRGLSEQYRVVKRQADYLCCAPEPEMQCMVSKGEPYCYSHVMLADPELIEYQTPETTRIDLLDGSWAFESNGTYYGADGTFIDFKNGVYRYPNGTTVDLATLEEDASASNSSPASDTSSSGASSSASAALDSSSATSDKSDPTSTTSGLTGSSPTSTSSSATSSSSQAASTASSGAPKSRLVASLVGVVSLGAVSMLVFLT